MVPAATVEPMITALRGLGREVDYLVLEGEGHSFRLAGSQERELATTVQFLDRIAPLEGRLNPPS